MTTGRSIQNKIIGRRWIQGIYNISTGILIDPSQVVFAIIDYDDHELPLPATESQQNVF